MFRRRYKIRFLPLHNDTLRGQKDKEADKKQSTVVRRSLPFLPKKPGQVNGVHNNFTFHFFFFCAIQGNPIYKDIQGDAD